MIKTSIFFNSYLKSFEASLNNECILQIEKQKSIVSSQKLNATITEKIRLL